MTNLRIWLSMIALAAIGSTACTDGVAQLSSPTGPTAITTGASASTGPYGATGVDVDRSGAVVDTGAVAIWAARHGGRRPRTALKSKALTSLPLSADPVPTS